MTASDFVKTKGKRFIKDGKDYFLFSANYWQAMNLGAVSEFKGDQKRFLQDLDHMKSVGINNLRIMAASEGPNDFPYRMAPALMESPGNYNQAILDGLDFSMAEIAKRGFTVTLVLNNFWHWSGGFSQYVNWITGEEIPFPPSFDRKLGDYTQSTSDENWSIFIDYASRFYCDPKVAPQAKEIYQNHIEFILNHRNKYTGILYKEDPTIFSFELANEPQTPTSDWCETTAAFIKSIAPNHMVTVGLESKYDEKDFINAHACKSIDYACNHIWVQNRGEYDMLDSSEKNIAHAIKWGCQVVTNVNRWAMKIEKPLVLEEFGFPRDNWHSTEKQNLYSAKNPITNRDKYYKAMLERVVELRKQGGAYCGFGFWVYSGCSRPGDDWIGDPHHEAPGWYGVYDTDMTTLEIMGSIAKSAEE